MRKVKQNIWGNWVGYVKGRRVQEFGTSEIAAGHWLLTGIVDFTAGYEHTEECRNAAFSSK